MKVSELIQALSAFDPEMDVYVHGYEGGLLPMNHIEQMPVVHEPKYDETSWTGNYVLGGNVDALVFEHSGWHKNAGWPE